MSTTFVPRSPLTLPEALERTGWRVDQDATREQQRIDDLKFFVITDGFGNYLHVTTKDGQKNGQVLEIERYGRNDAEEFANILDLCSEYDDDYWKIVGVDDEDEDKR